MDFGLWWELQKTQIVIDLIILGVVILLAIGSGILKKITEPLFRKER
jgi:hypothetical protein